MNTDKICLIISDYYSELADKAIKQLSEALKNQEFTIVKVPGTYEIPFVIHLLKNNFKAFIPFGVVLQGKTSHDSFISDHIRSSFTKITFESIIIGNAIIIAKNKKLALSRIDYRCKEAVDAVLRLLSIKSKSYLFK